MGIVGTQPLLSESQQFGHTGQVEQSRHAVCDAIGLLLKEDGPGREVPGAHGFCGRKMQPHPGGLMKAGGTSCWARLGLRAGLSLEGFGV